MFVPGGDAAKKNNAMRAACAKIKGWVAELLPKSIPPESVRINVREVICGDPECAPIDTAVEFWFGDHKPKGFGIPKESALVTHDDMLEELPSHEILEAWSRGEDPEWPPPDGEPDLKLKCAIGDDVEVLCGDGKWRRATVEAQWVRERGWPSWAYFPYRAVLAETGVPTLVPSDASNYIRSYRAAGYDQDGNPKPEPASASTNSADGVPTPPSAASGATNQSAGSAPTEAVKNEHDSRAAKRPRVDADAGADSSTEATDSKGGAATGGDGSDNDNGYNEDDEVDENEEGDEEDDEDAQDDDDEDDEWSEEENYWATLHAPHEPAWRFQIGDKVLVSVEDWEIGTVEMRDVSEPPAEGDDYEFVVIPYVVRVGDSESEGAAAASADGKEKESQVGRLVTVPFDADGAIRVLPEGHTWSRETGLVWPKGTAPPKPPRAEGS